MNKESFEKVKEGLGEIIDEATEKGRQVLADGKAALKKGKKEVYRGIHSLETEIATEGTPLNKAAAAAEQGAKKVGELASHAKDEAVDLHSKIQAKGGYIAVARRFGDELLDRFEEGVQKFEDRFFTDGKYDPKKGTQFLRENTKGVQEFGEKAYNRISRLIRSGILAVQDDYKSIILTEEELESEKYKGMATDFEGTLLKPDLDDCFIFYTKAKTLKLPNGLRVRTEILTDIKASVSSNLGELEAYYAKKLSKETEADKKEHISLKLEKAKQYLI